MTLPEMPGYDPRTLFPDGYGQPRDISDRPVAYIPEVGVAPAFQTPGYPVTRTEIDADQLQQDLVQTLGRDVAIVARAATDSQNGVLRIMDPRTGLELNVAPTVVAAVLADHTPPETSDARFLREFDEAPDVEAKLNALRDRIARGVAEEERGRYLRNRTRARLAALTPRLSAQVADQPDRPKVPPPVTSRNPWARRSQRQ